MGLKLRRPLKSSCVTAFTVLNGDEEAAKAIILSAILAYCSTLASSWPTKAERRLVGNAVIILDLIILSCAFNPITENRLITACFKSSLFVTSSVITFQVIMLGHNGTLSCRLLF